MIYLFLGPDLQTAPKFPLTSTPKGVLATQKHGNDLYNSVYDLVRFECNGRNFTSCSWEFVQSLKEGVIEIHPWTRMRQVVIPLPDSYDLCV